jgi:hypothetical protein
MDCLLCVSFIGTLTLLVAHTVDYALDVMRRPAVLRMSMTDEDGPIVDAGMPHELARQYERVA